MNTLKSQVLDHEGAISGPKLSHHEFIISYTGQHDPGPSVEPIAFLHNGGGLVQAIDSALGTAYLDAEATADTAAVHAPSNLYTITCKAHIP